MPILTRPIALPFPASHFKTHNYWVKYNALMRTPNHEISQNEQTDEIIQRMMVSVVCVAVSLRLPIPSHDDAKLVILLESPFDFINSHTGLSPFNAAQLYDKDALVVGVQLRSKFVPRGQVNTLVCTIRMPHSLDHEFLDRGLDLGDSSLGVQALSNNEMNCRISARLSSLDCLFGMSNSFLNV